MSDWLRENRTNIKVTSKNVAELIPVVTELLYTSTQTDNPQLKKLSDEAVDMIFSKTAFATLLLQIRRLQQQIQELDQQQTQPFVRNRLQ